MIACPDCGGDTSVTETRGVGPLRARRRRQCDVCRHRFTTVEMPATGRFTGADYVAVPKQLIERALGALKALGSEPDDDGGTP